MEKKNIVVWTRFKPSSADPMKYDLSVHHVTMRSAFASLVSLYKTGEIAPQVAKQWSVSTDKKEWKMVIDENWTFSNGEKIKPETVLKNFKRVLVLKNAEKSQSGLLEFLEQANQLTKINEDISGLSIEGNKVVFRFIKPMPDFLEKISFGIYSIAHPENYDDNGNWLNPRSAIFSGKYEITQWDDENFVLSLRKNFYNIDSDRIEKIVFNFSSNPEIIKNSDIMIREKLNPNADLDLWEYSSTARDNNITYVKVMKWQDHNSSLSNKKVRQALRNVFYDSLEKAGLKVTTSFFPLTIKDVKPFNYERDTTYQYDKNEFTTQPFFTTPEPLDRRKKELGDIYSEAYIDFCKKIKTSPKNVDYPKNEDDEKLVFDIQFLGTGILIDSPREDIKFMFMSKQGIQLPDETGEIIKTLEKDENFNVQEINNILWDQAIIWPIRHFSVGFWIKKDSKIDTSELNLNLHPIDFQFLKWK